MNDREAIAPASQELGPLQCEIIFSLTLYELKNKETNNPNLAVSFPKDSFTKLIQSTLKQNNNKALTFAYLSSFLL